jgi:hypothetical protein
VLAVRDTVRNRKIAAATDVHHESQKSSLYEGLTRSYQPRDEDGDQLPTEHQNVQANVDTFLNRYVEAVARDWNLMATIDAANQEARADVRVPTGQTTSTGEPVYRTVLRDVPATHLLYLARELDDVYTFVSKLPTLDPAVRWTYNENAMAYVGDPVRTHRTKKVWRNHVKAEATDRHPAQVDTYTEDVVVGVWTLVRRSGALPLERKAQLLRRVDLLRIAVKEAREHANQVEVTDVEVARPIFDLLFGDDDA